MKLLALARGLGETGKTVPVLSVGPLAGLSKPISSPRLGIWVVIFGLRPWVCFVVLGHNHGLQCVLGSIHSIINVTMKMKI